MHAARTRSGDSQVPKNSTLRVVHSSSAHTEAAEPPAPPSDPAPHELPPALPESALRYTLQATLAISALLLLSPILLVVGIAVKLSSPGPLFYGGVRVGKNQQTYTMYKFRTLRQGSEKQIGGRRAGGGPQERPPPVHRCAVLACSP